MAALYSRGNYPEIVSTKKIIGVFLPDNFKVLTARQLRKTKSLFLHEQTEVKPQTVASVMNHSVETNEIYYMETSPEKAKTEMANFWDAAHEAATHIKVITEGDRTNNCRIAAGHCEAYKSPQSAVVEPPIFPDCRSQYGCLFCTHYVCHANDEEDIHKLFSLLYIVNGVLNGTSDTDKVKELFLLLSARVRLILQKVRSMSDTGRKTINKISEIVLKYGELTPYWENRLQRYESLGIIFDESQCNLKI